MQHRRLSLLAFGMLAILASDLVPMASAICCKHACCGMFRCCGVGKCNIFCCKCDNGCRSCTQTLFKTIAGLVTCLGCPVAVGAAAGSGGLAAGAAAATCVTCTAVGRDRRSTSYTNYYMRMSDDSVGRDRSASDIICRADKDGDGAMNVAEAADFLELDGKLTSHEAARAKRSLGAPDWFGKIDANGDGFITLGELDG